MLDQTFVFRALLSSSPVGLNDLPRSRGIYALHDHMGTMRYIGITQSSSSNFYDRIYNRHVTGSESRSHKFSHAYNTGRMWRALKDNGPDASAAKRLRTAFVRRYCKASYLEVAAESFGELPKLELAVQALAGREMLTWCDKRGFSALPEPKGLVDALIDDLRFSSSDRATVERQARRQNSGKLV